MRDLEWDQIGYPAQSTRVYASAPTWSNSGPKERWYLATTKGSGWYPRHAKLHPAACEVEQCIGAP